MVILTQHLSFLVLVLTAASSSISENSRGYSRQIKVGKISPDLVLSGLVSSQSYRDRLYSIHGSQVIALEKQTAHKVAAIDVSSDLEPAASWEAIAVGPCGNEEAESCLYLAKISRAGVLLVLRFEEATINSSSSLETASVDGLEEISVALPSASPNSEDIFILVSNDADITVIYLDNSLSYIYYEIENSQWTTRTKLAVEGRRVRLQEDMIIRSMDWNADTSTLIVQNSKEEVFLHNIKFEELSPVEALLGKPHKLELRIPKLHALQYVCWDIFTDSLYATLLGKHGSLFTYKPVTSEDYQRDGAAATITKYTTRVRVREESKERGALSSRQECADGNSMCSAWAQSGNCERNSSREYMVQNCKLSCKLCTQGGFVSTMCQDMHLACSAWSSAGHCEKRSDYMYKNCAASCGRCSSQTKLGSEDSTVQSDQSDQSDQASHSTSECKDRVKYCKRWASDTTDNKCTRRKDYMLLKCPDSCGLCGRKEVAAEREPEAQCEDKSKYCLIWEAYGYCKAKKKYMTKNCPSACKLCRRRSYAEAGNKCVDRHDFCATWSKYRMCSVKATYMKENCPLSCGKCKLTESDSISNRIIDGGEEETKPPAPTTTQRPAPTTTKRPVTAVNNKLIPASECVDKNQYCVRRQEGGYCTLRPDYMSVHCKKSCNLCANELRAVTATANPTTKSKPRTTVPVAKACQDSKSYCKVWAGAGLCNTRPQVMNSICPASCKICPKHLPNDQLTTTTSPPKTTTAAPKQERSDKCEDKTGLCSLWETAGRCTTRKQEMRLNCAKTCQFCDTKNEVTSVPKCEDRTTYCESWARARRCHMYVGYMKTNCAKSCKMCSEESLLATKKIEPNCTDDNQYCEKWAGKGYCKIRPDYMNKKCRLSCKLC